VSFRIIRQNDIDGFSIVELIVVIAIIAILMTISTISFNDWRVKHGVEAQVRQMVADFNELRVRALTMKQRHSITLNANSYVFRSYTSEPEDLYTGGTTITGGVHTVSYKLKDSSAIDYASQVFEIDQRGANVSSVATIYLEYPGATSGLNCIKLHTVRINPGNSATIGGTCNDK
jgi:prepilin-type N-terminal cleavage/methylation domain-containing protein